MKSFKFPAKPCLLILSCCLLWAASCRGPAMTEAQGWRQMSRIEARIQPPTFPDRDFVLTAYGAKGDGETDCTEAFRRAIEACCRAGGGRVVVPAGTWKTGAIHLQSNVNLHLERGATVRFSTDPADYPTVYTRFEGTECMNYSPLIYAFEQENLAITGEGTLDGCAGDENWWRWKNSQKADVTALCEQAEQGTPVEERRYGLGRQLRPNMIQPYRCRNILIEGVTVRNSPMWHIHPVLSQNITVRNVTVIGHGPNNDGCNPESSRDVLIEGCFFDTGDDCIAIKSGRNADGRRVNVPSENIIIRRCTMKDGHGGVVIGSEVSGGVRNVFAEECLMNSPNLDRGLRIKTNSMRGGVVENIFMRNVTMEQVREAALKINYYYQEGDRGPFPPTVRNVFMTNVRCLKSEYPWHIRGYAHNPVRNVVLTDCTFKNTRKEGLAEGIEGFVVRAKEEAAGELWSQKMADTIVTRNADYWSLELSTKPKWTYTYGTVLKALWDVWEVTGDPRFFDYVQGYYEAMIDEDGTIRTYDLKKYNIDMIKPGSALISVYEKTKKDKYRTAIETLRRQMREHPRTSAGGFWHKQIYPHQMWLDGLYMGSPFLAQYAGRFGEPALYDDVAKQILLMEKVSRDAKTGLLYHGWDESREQKWADPKTGCSPHFWGRAMGWYAMAIVDVLDELPKDHPQRDEIIAVLDRMFEALVRVQDVKTGVWYQVLDQGGREGNYLESTASTMFVYSMAKAVRMGYVDAKYLAAARRGWEGILNEFITVDENGYVDIHRCCSVGGLGGNPYRDGSYEYYVGEKIRSNDPKAIGPFILAALEMERLRQD